MLANKPDQIAAVSTVNVGENVQISWDMSPNSRYSDVVEYQVKVRRSDGSFILHPECDGTDPAVIAARTCLVSMSSLVVADFNLVQADEIQATISALNQIGFSEPSEPAGMALVQVAPQGPLTKLSRGSQTSESTVEVEFATHLLDGGAAIQDYCIEMDTGNGFRVVSPSSLTQSPVQISEPEIASGLHIYFRHRVWNAHGWSEYSETVTIVAATVPEPPSSV